MIDPETSGSDESQQTCRPNTLVSMQSGMVDGRGRGRIVGITGVPMHHRRIVQFPRRAVTTDWTFPNAIDP
ncbi:unnamed protein product [Lasius platythorax]|uniref:Uncharacterized protein n=1 Tax=Lasius platythorax TaxID=488582 RepID=A0AAV2N8N4_9HYME